MIERAFRQVVLDEDKFAGDAASFSKYHTGVGRVVKDINQEANIEGFIRERKVRAVKSPAFYGTDGTLTDLDALNIQPRHE